MISIVKINSNSKNSILQRVLKVLRLGKSDVQTAIAAAPFGVDSVPIKDTVAVYAQTSDKETKVLIGYLNKNSKAGDGELRLFSVDANGIEKTFLWLKSSGDLELNGATYNAVRFQQLQTGFDQLKTELNALITAYNTHQHTSTAPTLPTVGNTSPGVAATASIATAKSDTVKVG